MYFSGTKQFIFFVNYLLAGYLVVRVLEVWLIDEEFIVWF